MRIALALGLAVWLGTLSGCAMLTGTATGAFTGAVDLPAETYRQNCQAFVSHPILYSLDAVVLGPIGLVFGPVFGMGKGLALDIQWVIGQVYYGDVFGTYGPTSIWRPYTLRWPVIKPEPCLPPKRP